MSKTDYYLKEVFPQDLDAYGISLKEKDFKWSNIFANRIMSNSFLFDNKECGIVGHVLKEIASDGLTLQEKDSSILADYSQLSRKVVGGIITTLEKNQFTLDHLWELYSNQQQSTNKMFQSEIEQKAYISYNEAFSIAFIDNLINLLEKNIDVLLETNNNFFKGILTETARISKVHSISKEQERFLSLFRAINRIDDYNKTVSKGAAYVKISKNQIIPLVNKIIEIYRNKNNDNFKSQIDDLLWEMIKIWRFYFIKYLEVSTPSFSARAEKIYSEEEEESELVDKVKEQIEKEMGG